MNLTITTVRPRVLVMYAVSLIVIASATACGTDSGSGTTSIPRVVASERIYTVEDLSAAGAKTVKSYDVAELPGAISVWKTVFNKLDYEARFYPSHDEAVTQGTVYADSVTGDDAVVKGNEVLWEEGERDRRKCSRAAGTPHSSCSYSARYLEYIIRGNMILFCEGSESSDAFANCEHLLSLTEPA